MTDYTPTTEEVRDAYVVGMEHDCYPDNQRKLTGHGWCPGWDNCECECHEERGHEVFEPLPVEGESDGV